jgi:LysM repeat protein
MVWESKNQGNFWSDEEKRFYLYARQRLRANRKQQMLKLRRRILWTIGAVIGISLVAATVARSADPLAEKQQKAVATQLPQITQTQVITVAPGDSLWSIARRNSLPGSSTMEQIARISALNGNPSGKLEPGQRLVIPATP